MQGRRRYAIFKSVLGKKEEKETTMREGEGEGPGEGHWARVDRFLSLKFIKTFTRKMGKRIFLRNFPWVRDRDISELASLLVCIFPQADAA